MVSEAKPIAQALAEAIGCDARTKDTGGVWRVPGLLNWPNKKLERGRSSMPQLVTVAKTWTGERIEPEALAEAVKGSRHESSDRQEKPGQSGASDASVEDLLARCSAAYRKLIKSPPEPFEDRSAVAFSVVLYLLQKTFSAEDIKRLIEAHPKGIGARYADGKDLDADIRRAQKKNSERRNSTVSDETLSEAAELDGGVITQDGVARAFAQCYAGRLRYDHHAGAWFEWDGTHWRRDEQERAFQFARVLGREMSDGEKEAVVREVRKVQFAGGVEKLARGDEALAVTTEAWDRDPYLLGTRDGTVDLRTGKLRAADPAEGITKLTAVAPTETTDCPRFLRFIDETFSGDEEVIRFVQRWAGYCLTGDTREHALVFGEGSGGNGKSVLVGAIAGVMGDYATMASMEVFTASDWDRHPTELARLRGARLVTASETEEDRVWAEARIKALTGGDRIAARFMRQDFFEFQPAFKLFIVGNHRPALRNVDDAMRRRLNILAFRNKPVIPDRGLEEKLRAEWPGILRWMIAGCLAWQAEGLRPPESVQEATHDYFNAQDTLSEWLAAECIVELENDYRKATTKELFESWAAFACAAHEPCGTEKSFVDRLQKRGLRRCEKVPTADGKRMRGFYGIELRRQQDHRSKAA